MASATTSTTAWVLTTSAASATVLAPSTSADVLTSEGDCDCDGNQLDALGVCGGDCAADADADGTCDDVDDCVGAYDECGICNGPGAIYECDVLTFQKGYDRDGRQLDARLVNVEGRVWQMRTPMAPVTTLTTAWVRTTSAASATDLVPSTSADVLTFQKETARAATATSSKRLVNVEGRVADEDADGICGDVDDCVGEPTSAASVTALERFTSADVLTSQKETATATATSSTRLVCVAVTAQRTPMPMASAT